MSKLTKSQRRAKRKKKRTEQNQRRRENSSTRPQPWKAVKMKMFRVPNPLEGVPQDERLEVVRDIGRRAKQEFQAKYAAAEEWFREYDPLYILSFCAMYFTSSQEGIDPEVSGKLDFPPHLLELLQALALTRERTISSQPLLDKADDLQNAMRELGDLMMLRLVGFPDDVSSEEAMHAHTLRMEMMANTTAIRNWAYFHQMKRVCIELAALIDPQFKAVYHPSAPARPLIVQQVLRSGPM